jgi:hypothetical protein
LNTWHGLPWFFTGKIIVPPPHASLFDCAGLQLAFESFGLNVTTVSMDDDVADFPFRQDQPNITPKIRHAVSFCLIVRLPWAFHWDLLCDLLAM